PMVREVGGLADDVKLLKPSVLLKLDTQGRKFTRGKVTLGATVPAQDLVKYAYTMQQRHDREMAKDGVDQRAGEEEGDRTK
ncbi:MAG: hypothetical protein AAGI01_08860, partial [Myxococcota bacterium]